MVGPGRLWNQELLVGVESVQEVTNDSQGTSTRDGLGSDNSVLFNQLLTVDILAGVVENKALDGVLELLGTSDTGVFLFNFAGKQDLFSFLDTWEDDRLTGVVSVGSDTQVDLGGVGVLVVGFGDTQDLVWRSQWDFAPLSDLVVEH